MYETETVSGIEQQLLGVIDLTPELSGLGAFQRRKIANTLAKQVKQQNFTDTQTRAMKFLISKIDELTDQTKKDLLAGLLIFQDAEIYFRRKISGGGIQLILDSTNIKRVGASFIDKNYFPDRVNAVLSSIKTAVGYHATKTDPVGITYTTDNTMVGGVGQLPNEIVNGELEIATNDKPIVLLPFSGFFRTGNIVQTNDPKSDFKPLEGMKLIKEQVPMTINAKITEGGTVPTDKNYFIDITLKTVLTKPR